MQLSASSGLVRWLVLAAMIVVLSIAPNANAQEQCVGLDCPGVLPASSLAHGMLHSVASPRDLETMTASGFYEFGENNPAVRARAVAYVATPGTLYFAPPEVQALPAFKSVSAANSKTNTIVIYGAGVLVQASPADETEPAAAPTTAATRRDDSVDGNSHRREVVAHKSSQEDCPSGWFCLFSYYGYANLMGEWHDTGSWQDLATWGWANLAHSMVNNRSGATLLATGTGGSGSRYCARPNSVDSDLSNNGNIDGNAESLYNSTAPDYHASWNCFNPY